MPDHAREAAEEIRNLVFGCDGCAPDDGVGNCGNNGIDFDCEGAVERYAAIIGRHCGEADKEIWHYEAIPSDKRVLVAVAYPEGYPERVGIAECTREDDGEIDVMVDDGIERFSLHFPGTIYAWQELSSPPPLPKEAEHEAARI